MVLKINRSAFSGTPGILHNSKREIETVITIILCQIMFLYHKLVHLLKRYIDCHDTSDCYQHWRSQNFSTGARGGGGGGGGGGMEGW